MEKTHSHDSNLTVFPGVFLPFYLKSFTFLNIVPHGDTVMPASPSSLFYQNPKEMQEMHSNEKYLRTDTTTLFLEIHLQDMQESIISPCRSGT